MNNVNCFISNFRKNTLPPHHKEEGIWLKTIDYAKAFDCVDHNNCGKFLKRWQYQTILPASWEICMQVKKQLLELDMEKQIGSKLEKEYIKAVYQGVYQGWQVYCHPAYLTYMQSTSYEMLGWMRHKL